MSIYVYLKTPIKLGTEKVIYSIYCEFCELVGLLSRHVNIEKKQKATKLTHKHRTL